MIAQDLEMNPAARALVALHPPRRSWLSAPRAARRAAHLPLDEAWRQVYTQLFDQGEGQKPQLLAVTSAYDGEGKTTVALGLALTIANDLNRNVLLLDCNLFNPALSDSLGITNELGLANWLGLSDLRPGELALEKVRFCTALKNLWVVPSGPRTSIPSKLIRSESMANLLQEARARHEIIIMDTPSLLTASDSRVLVSYSDAVVLVVRAGNSTSRSLSQILSLTEKAPRRGIVVNDFRCSIPGPLRRFFPGA